MDNQELFEAIKQLIREETAPMKADISGLKILMDVEMRKSIDLLGEGQQIIIDRLPDSDQADLTEARLSAVEIMVKRHSKDIQVLKKAQ